MRMRLATSILMTSAATLGFCAVAAWQPAAAQATGLSEPKSSAASNIAPGDTSSTIAPSLPAPPVGDAAPPRAFLRAARHALAIGETGQAQEALERAESRALDRSVAPGAVERPSRQAMVRQITAAREALAAGDRARAIQLIDAALRRA